MHMHMNISSAPSSGLLTPPPSTNNQTDRSLSNSRDRVRSASFSSPLFMGMTSNTRSRSASIISADGTPQLLLTPGSASVSANINTSRPSSRTGSTNRSRPGSSNRNRRSVTPSNHVLLGAGFNRSNVHSYDNSDDDDDDDNDRGPATHSPHLRPSTGSTTAPAVSTTTHRVVGLGAGMAIGTIIPSKQLSSLTESRREYKERTSSSSYLPAFKSEKQGPGHRKVRRWNNDKFIGKKYIYIYVHFF